MSQGCPCPRRVAQSCPGPQKGHLERCPCAWGLSGWEGYDFVPPTHPLTHPCAPQELSGFTLDPVAFEDGKGKCPYDPTKGHTGLIVGR